MLNDKFLTIKQVCNIIPYSRQHIYLLIKQEKFPKQIKLGAARVVWSEKELANWLQEKINKRQEC